MSFASFCISRFRLTQSGLRITRRCFVSFAPVSALYKKCTSFRCRFAVFEGCFVRTAHSQDCKRTPVISYAAACLFLFAAVLVPAFGIMFYNRRERRKLSTMYEDEIIYQTPFVDTKSGFLVQRNGYWFPVVLFSNFQRFEQIRHFALNDDDILIVSFPKSGRV